jgi:hypothetical protein
MRMTFGSDNKLTITKQTPIHSKIIRERYQTSPAEAGVAIRSHEEVVSSPRLFNAYHSAIEFIAPYTQAILVDGAGLVCC